MDLASINTVLLPMVLLAGMILAMGMVLTLFLDVVRMYWGGRRGAKKGEVREGGVGSSPRLAESGDPDGQPQEASLESTGEAVGAPDALTLPEESLKQKRMTNVGGMGRFSRALGFGIKLRIPSIRLFKHKMNQDPLVPPQAAIPKDLLNGPDRKEALVGTAGSEPTSEAISSVGSGGEQQETQAPSLVAPNANEGQKEGGAESENEEKAESKKEKLGEGGASAERAGTVKKDDVKEKEGEKAVEESAQDQKVKVKPISSLAEARSIIEAKAKSKPAPPPAVDPGASEAGSGVAKGSSEAGQAPTETDDVAALLGISSEGSKPKQDAPDPPKSSTPEIEAPAPTINPSRDVDQSKEGAAEAGESGGGFKDVDTPISDLSAAELLQRSEPIGEVSHLPKQLHELKTSLFQLEQKLKNLKKTEGEAT
ncbi:MAG: hypothetical protein QFX34_05165 [Candidatus Verstraetearchaeota archaeon]|nr:hypothetical protein [Candidatus Verstraetearchaeota archaeon]